MNNTELKVFNINFAKKVFSVCNPAWLFFRSKYSNSGFFIIGDFKYLTNGHNLKQTVKYNTKESKILDKSYTNAKQLYARPEVISHLGISDHSAVLFKPSKLVRHKIGKRSRN